MSAYYGTGKAYGIRNFMEIEKGNGKFVLMINTGLFSFSTSRNRRPSWKSWKWATSTNHGGEII